MPNTICTSNSIQPSFGAVGSTNGIAAGVGIVAQNIGQAQFASNTASGQFSSTLRSGGTEYGKTYIKTNKHTIDLDELGDMMETLKRRLLILTPKFEQLEKYPMLKAAYDEFKMLEKLLGEPDDTK
jgi:hypothetical protein